MAAKLDEQFNMTCPVTSIHKVDSKISSDYTKTVQDIRKKSYPTMCRLAAAERRKLGVSASSQKTRAGRQTTRGDQESHDNEGISKLYSRDRTT